MLTECIGFLNCQANVLNFSSSILLRVEGGSDFHISPDGREITHPGREGEPLEGLNREIFLGLVQILAPALRKSRCLHASAARYNQLQPTDTLTFSELAASSSISFLCLR